MSCGCARNRFATRARARVTIQARTGTDDGYGGRTETWADAATVWAVIEPMGGRETFVSAQVQSRVDARVLIRWQRSLADTAEAAKLRLRAGTRFYDVAAVRNLADDLKTEGTAYQQLLCTEGEPS